MATGQAEVVIIGGGPAGSTVATLLARRGIGVELFERDRFPRFHIGESLIPETYWIFERLGLLPKMRASRFVRKHSVQFIAADGRESSPFYFADNKPGECSQTWQVARSEFDKLLLDHAREHGATVHEGVRVHEVLFEGDRAVGVRVRDDGGFRDVRAEVVVDASGQQGLIMNRLGLRIWDPILAMGAIWTYWKGAHRDEGRDAGATLVIQSGNRKGWFWYIPLQDDLTSVGVVAPFDYIFKGRGDYASTYDEELEACPGARTRVESATRATGYFATKDFSYRSTRVAGDGWVLVGDAFGFLDPLYSSGVLLALKSGQLAADAIADGLAAGDTSAARLGAWGPLFNQGIDRMRRLVCEYYAGFSFGAMMRKYPELRGAVTDLLIGDLFRGDVDRVWGPMESLYEPGREPIPKWDTGRPARRSGGEEIEIVLPDGKRP